MSNLLYQYLNQKTHGVTWSLLLDRAISIGIGVIGALFVFLLGRWLIYFVLCRVFKPFISRETSLKPHLVGRLTTLQGVARSAMLYTLYFIVVGMLLTAVGLNPASLIATAGIAGVAIGFGAQKLVRDVVTGFLLLMEDQFAVGDQVTIGGNTGTVEETGMRNTKIRDDVGRLIILSNGDITQVINYSRGIYRFNLDLALAADIEPDAVKALLPELEKLLAGETPKIDKVSYRGVVGMSTGSVTYRLEASCPPEHRLYAEPRLREVVRRLLLEKGVKLA